MESILGYFKKHGFEISLVLPLLAYIAGFTYFPVLEILLLSFDADPDQAGLQFGFRHYREIFHHFQFARALRNTLLITVVSLFLELALGLFVAIQLNKHLKLRGLMRAVYLLPLGIPTIVAASSMRYLFDTNGFINQTLAALGLMEAPFDWGGGGVLTLSSIVVSDMWKVTPLVMLILLAGLETIPEEIHEAARIDGAGQWKSFCKVTLPLLKPSITMALVIRGIDSFRIFELPLVLAGKSEPVLATLAYSEYHEALNAYTSAAVCVILLLLILGSMAAYLFLSESGWLSPKKGRP